MAGRRSTSLRAGVPVLLVLVALHTAHALDAPAPIVTTGGHGRLDCWLGLEVRGFRSLAGPDGRWRIYQEACGDACVFSLRLCINLPLEGCAPATIRDVRVGGDTRLAEPLDLSGPAACGAASELVLALGSRKKRAKRRIRVRGRAVGRRGKDADQVTLVCMRPPPDAPCERCGDGVTAASEECDDGNTVDGDGCDSNCRRSGCGNAVRDPQEECDDGNAADGDGCDSNCTATRCGNGVVAGEEECDPPGPSCDAECRVSVPTSCACGTPEPTLLELTAVDRAGVCGQVASGATAVDLPCGGLFLGGRRVGFSLPARIPAGTAMVTGVACDGGALTLFGVDTGDPSTCTRAECPFGPPLAFPNEGLPSVSTCVRNVLTQDVAGQADCRDGTAELRLRLTASIFVTGDTAPGRPGIQACPECVGGTCRGGPRDGQSCRPHGPEIAASHDCLADPVGTLPLEFVLGNVPSARTAPDGLFCGSCRDADDTGGFGICAGGLNAGEPCDQNANCIGGGTCGDVRPCATNLECAEPRETCEPRDPGAFGAGGRSLTTISTVGIPAGDLTDAAPRASTFGTIFCIPPTLQPALDTAADLPGPGAVTLPGTMRLR
jgi:cysteine-rich repeat protein